MLAPDEAVKVGNLMAVIAGERVTDGAKGKVSIFDAEEARDICRAWQAFVRRSGTRTEGSRRECQVRW